MGSEQEARAEIVRLLAAAGWHVQDSKAATVSSRKSTADCLSSAKSKLKLTPTTGGPPALGWQLSDKHSPKGNWTCPQSLKKY